MQRGQAGFTLLEVVVAMVIVGSGIALALTAISGSARLESRMAEQQAAMHLARAKLDEVLQDAEVFELASDAGESHFAGTDFGYRVQARPISLVPAALQSRLPAGAGQAEEVAIEVFWGPKPAVQSYRLVTYRKLATAVPPLAAVRPAASGPAP